MPPIGSKPTPVADNPISRFLRRWLDEHEWSRVRAARKWGISQGTLRNVEAGIDLSTGRSYRPKLHTLRRLAAGMGVPLEVLLKLPGEEVKPPPSTAEAALNPATLADLLDRKVLGLYGGHLALSRDVLEELLACFKTLEHQLEELRRRAHRDGLSPIDRRKLREQVNALRRQVSRSLQPLEAYTGILEALLQALQEKVEPEVIRLSQELLQRIREELVRQGEQGVPPADLGGQRTDTGTFVALRPAPDRPRKKVEVAGKIAAGKPYYEDEGYPEAVLEVDAEEIHGADYAMQVTGDSLVDAHICEGDWLFFQKTDRADPGDLVSAWVPQEGRTVKFFQVDNGRAWLVPANRKYHRIPFTDECYIQARVVHLRRNFGLRGKNGF